MHASVEQTGKNTFFGRTATLLQSVDSLGSLQRVLMRVVTVLLVRSPPRHARASAVCLQRVIVRVGVAASSAMSRCRLVAFSKSTDITCLPVPVRVWSLVVGILRS